VYLPRCGKELSQRLGTVDEKRPTQATQYERADVSPNLHRLGDYQRTTGPLDELTDRHGR